METRSRKRQRVAQEQNYSSAMFSFAIGSLPDVPLRIICDFLTITDKKNLRLVNTSVAGAVIALDPAMRLWTVNLDKNWECVDPETGIVTYEHEEGIDDNDADMLEDQLCEETPHDIETEKRLRESMDNLDPIVREKIKLHINLGARWHVPRPFLQRWAHCIQGLEYKRDIMHAGGALDKAHLKHLTIGGIPTQMETELGRTTMCWYQNIYDLENHASHLTYFKLKVEELDLDYQLDSMCKLKAPKLQVCSLACTPTVLDFALDLIANVTVLDLCYGGPEDISLVDHPLYPDDLDASMLILPNLKCLRFTNKFGLDFLHANADKIEVLIADPPHGAGLDIVPDAPKSLPKLRIFASSFDVCTWKRFTRQVLTASKATLQHLCLSGIYRCCCRQEQVEDALQLVGYPDIIPKMKALTDVYCDGMNHWLAAFVHAHGANLHHLYLARSSFDGVIKNMGPVLSQVKEIVLMNRSDYNSEAENAKAIEDLARENNKPKSASIRVAKAKDCYVKFLRERYPKCAPIVDSLPNKSFLETFIDPDLD